ncbi:hypothetical protein QE152_g7429 [Popillia japonica]|uniref:Uncharacterized protein n=1 Tax=Popillia japonica TaxID=7064 RepID=A0AAW1ME08_POPJA
MPSNERITRSTIDDDVLIKKVIEKVLSSDILRKELLSKIRSEIIAEYKEELQALNEKVVQLEANLAASRNEMKKHTDELEQYSRRNNVRIFGVPEDRNENTGTVVSNFCKEKLHLDISPQLMDCHRLPGKESLHRPIIVKFVSHATKLAVLSKKKELKGFIWIFHRNLWTAIDYQISPQEDGLGFGNKIWIQSNA